MIRSPGCALRKQSETSDSEATYSRASTVVGTTNKQFKKTKTTILFSIFIVMFHPVHVEGDRAGRRSIGVIVQLEVDVLDV